MLGLIAAVVRRARLELRNGRLASLPPEDKDQDESQQNRAGRARWAGRRFHVSFPPVIGIFGEVELQ
jgi:hypothetical protein